jgi:hypothetical protein
MKSLNALIASVGILASSLFISSCDNDGYSLGDFAVNIATVNPGDGNAYSLTLDDGTTLWPASQNFFYKPKENQRALINYTPLQDNYEGYDLAVKVNDIVNVLTKNPTVLNTATADSLGNDPIRINDYWIGDGYLNVYFSIGITPYGNTKHFINLAKNELNGKENYYNLLHNAYNDGGTYRGNGYVSFNLDALKVEGETNVVFTIAVNTGENEMKEYAINYDWAEPEKAPKIISSQKHIIQMY